jgi:hypothetical protein
VELLIAVNPDPESRLKYLMRLPLAGGMVFRTSGTWPRTTALYCHPVAADDWPAEPDVVERVPLRSCARRGAAIDLVLDRGRQLVFTKAQGQGRRVLAVAADPQAGPPERTHADSPRRRLRRSGDRRRQP